MATEAPRTIPLAELFADAPKDGVTHRRTRTPRGPSTAAPGVDKATFKEMFELASAGLKLSGAKELALTPDEVEQMADAWYRLAKEYPSFGKYVTRGRKASVWGNLLMVNMIVIGKRVDVVADWWNRRERKPKPTQAPQTMRRTGPTSTAQPPIVRPAATGDYAPAEAPSQPDFTGVS
jgi:hypothetical protein